MNKHVLLSNYSSDVRFAGETWKGSDRKVYLNNNSGTYRPSLEELEQAQAYLQKLFPNAEIITVEQED